MVPRLGLRDWGENNHFGIQICRLQHVGGENEIDNAVYKLLRFRDWGQETGVKNNNFGNQNLKNRKVKRIRKQKRKRGSLREGCEAPPRRCPPRFRFCFRSRFNVRFFKFLFLYVYVLIFNCPVNGDSCCTCHFALGL